MAETRPEPALHAASRAPLLRRTWDVLVPTVLLLAGALAYAILPAGSVLRVALVLPTVFFVPGYLLLAALLGPAPAGSQGVPRLLAAVGVSPPLLGLMALATAWLPGGFRAGGIVVLATLACIAIAVVAVLRRRNGASAPPTARAATT